MGRAKLKMEFIENKKRRNSTFNKRKGSLIKKMQELTTLCDVHGCIIMYGPGSGGGGEPEIWSRHDEDVRKMIDIYRSGANSTKTFGLPDFFEARNRKMEEDLAKLRRMNMEAKYPPLPPGLLDGLGEFQLRELAAFLGNQAEYTKSRIKLLRMTTNCLGLGLDINNGIDLRQWQQYQNFYLFPDLEAISAASNILQYPAAETFSSGGGNMQMWHTRQQEIAPVDPQAWCYGQPPQPLYGMECMPPPSLPNGMLPPPPPPPEFNMAEVSHEGGQFWTMNNIHDWK